MSTGKVAAISALIKSLSTDTESIGMVAHLQAERNFLLTNGNQVPYPKRVLNQRQRRKRARQSNKY